MNYNYFAIDLSDIWSFIRLQFLNDQIEGIHASELIRKIQPLIVMSSKPTIKYIDYKEDNSGYYQKQVEGYRFQELRERYALDYFLNGDDIFQYDNEIIIASDNYDFAYWFGLKLRQYDLKLDLVKSFLDYQFKNSLQSYQDFERFVRIAVRQYDGVLLSDKLSLTVEEELSLLKNTEAVPAKGNLQKNKLAKSVKDNFQQFPSFKLRQGLHLTQRKPFLDVLNHLKASNLISQSTTIESFTLLFESKLFTDKNKIVWTGNNVQLQAFIKSLMANQIIELDKNKWKITQSCFVKSQGESFTTQQLRNANGKALGDKLEKVIVNLAHSAA